MKLKDTVRKMRVMNLYIVGLVQDTSSLEMQGLEDNEIDLLLKDAKEQFLYGDYQNKLWAS